MESNQIIHCYHCDLPVPQADEFVTTVLGEPRQMCCPGCQAVAEAIVDNGLEDYYRFRTESGIKGEALNSSIEQQLGMYDLPELQGDFVVDDGDFKSIQLTIEGINCAACGWLIEKQITKLVGIKKVSVNVASRRAYVEWFSEQVKLSEILTLIEKIGYHALPFQAEQHELSYQKENKTFLKKLGLSGLMTMQVMMLAIGLYFGLFGSIEPETKRFFHWTSLILTLPVVLYSGEGFYRSAVNSIKSGSVNMDVSITLAIWGTFLSSIIATVNNVGEIYFESVCMFIFLLLISRFLEHRTRHAAALISANMMKYVPVTATKIDDGQTSIVLATALTVGDIVLVKAGDTIPVDATVVDGSSSVDESMLTGEFDLVAKTQGSPVYGGTINQASTLSVKVEKPLKDALINKIVRLQEKALAEKPKIARYADTASRHFVFVVLLIAAVSYGVWYQYNPDKAFWIAIAVLVATCPCALGLATPSALTSAVAKLNTYGILLKRADVLEQVPNVDTIVFDKTGTLTKGQFSIVKSVALPPYSTKQIEVLAQSLELYSEHPIARAFNFEHKPLPVEAFVNQPGFGIKGTIANKEYRLGSINFITDSVPQDWLWANIFLQENDRLIAAFKVEDTIKEEAFAVTQRFAEFQQVLLSGDNQTAVLQVAKSLAIPMALADQTPQQKLDFIGSLHQAGKVVVMVGDGINDAPVLAAADVSIAVGSAADMAKRSADVILLGESIENIPTLFSIANRTRQKVKQNMAWALGYNVLILPLAVGGFLTPWMAVIGMSMSSIVVVLNSTRLLK